MNPLSASPPGGNPFETPRPRHIRITQGILRVVVALQCFGIAAAHLHQHLPDPLLEFLLRRRDWPADQVAHVADFLSYGLMICGVVTLLRPSLFILLPVAGYAAGIAIVPALQPEVPFDRFQPALQATVSVAPLALLLIDFWPPRLSPTLPMCLAATALLKFAVTAAFIAHGILCSEQARLGGPLLKMLEDAMRESFHREISLETLRSVLAIWGAIEIGFALALFTSRSRIAMAVCSVLGLLMAFLPTLANGVEGYHDSLRLVSLMGAPLALLMFHVACIREQPPVYLPERRRTSPSPDSSLPVEPKRKK